MIRILITLLVLFICFFGYSQKKLLPNGDDYYHSYTKKKDTVRIYDIGDNLVREAYLKEDRAVNFYNETIFWTHLESRYLLEWNRFVRSANKISYLYTKEIELEILSGGENGRSIRRPYIVSSYGFSELDGSEDNYMDNPLKHTDYITKNYSNVKKSSNTEILESKYQPETKIIKKYNEKENIHSCIFYNSNVKHLELFIRFNNQGLISDVLYIKTYSRGAKDESKNMWLKKVQYDKLGNIIEGKEWRFNDTNQVEKFIAEKGDDLFLSVIFENPEKYFDLRSPTISTVEYNEKLMTRSDSFNGGMKTLFLYDSKNRLQTSMYYGNDIYMKKTTFLYD